MLLVLWKQGAFFLLASSAQLLQLDRWLTTEIAKTPPRKTAKLGAALRNRALVLLGFWRAFRSNKLPLTHRGPAHFDSPNQGCSLTPSSMAPSSRREPRSLRHQATALRSLHINHV